MRIVFTAFAAGGLSTIAIMAAPAAARVMIPAVFSFTPGNIDNGQGGARFFSATSPMLGTFHIRATAWSLETNAVGIFVRKSELTVHSGGLGVISGDDGDGSQNRHTIDNNARKDFVLLQFDRQVRLTSATFNTLSVLGSTKDSDATIRHGVTAQPWDAEIPLENAPLARLNTFFTGSWSALNTSTLNSTRDPNPQLKAGNLWLIGADFINSDRRTDGFNLASIAVIPEPATWAMMVGGFGIAGGTLRRRPRQALA